RSLSRARLMELLCGNCLPLVLGSVGVLVLYQLLQRLRHKAYIQDAVVVITGASSGLGKAALSPAILPSMVQRRSGHIVVISSVQGKIAIPFRSAYAASKHATQAFFDCLRAEVEQYGIGVSIFSPGYIRTNLSLNAVTGDGSKHGVLDKNTAEGRDPRDVADAILKAVGRKKQDVLMAGLLPTVAVYMRTLCPALFFKFMAARARKERKAKDN
ncbi:DRS7B reductase, partial [Amia calva]|nr:DRS7B reductase [Amia calva]